MLLSKIQDSLSSQHIIPADTGTDVIDVHHVASR